MLILKLSSPFVVSIMAVAYATPTHGAPPLTPSAPPQTPSVVVKLNYGSFRGASNDSVISFRGIPFAKPPLGPLRFALPQQPDYFTGVRDASQFGAACIQQTSSILFPAPAKESEDCLFVNVVKPANAPKNKRLPVVIFWPPGGFQIGDSANYNPNVLVKRSSDNGEPIIYVSANYRLNAFGFLGGVEVKNAGIGNAGLEDQRFALQWVQKYIAQFGGDPSRVTIWGQSSTAISVGLHLVLDNGNAAGLFHRALMQSGSQIRLPKITQQQKYFDQLVSLTNCTSSADRLNCLRGVPLDAFTAAVKQTPNFLGPQSLNLAYTPMVDGRLIKRDPLQSVRDRKVARVPIIVGNVEDEGTLFSLGLRNITTNEQFLQFMKSNYFPNITPSQLQDLERLYPDDVTQGSPFGTGTANSNFPQYKRLAAAQGDYEFQAPRRALLNAVCKTQPAYAFRNQRAPLTGPPGGGVSHNSDLNEFFGLFAGTDFFSTDSLIRFAHTGNPNPHSSSPHDARWKLWSSNKTSPPELTYVSPAPALTITEGTYRKAGMELMTAIALNEAERT